MHKYFSVSVVFDVRLLSPCVVAGSTVLCGSEQNNNNVYYERKKHNDFVWNGIRKTENL